MDGIANNEIPLLPNHVIKIVWQYALQDQRYLNEQKKHLSTLSSSGLIDMLDPRGIPLGLPMNIMDHIGNADIVIPLMSSDLFNSTDDYVIDTQYLFEMHRDGKVYVLSIYISACTYQSTPLGHLSVIGAKGEAITKFRGNERQKAYANVAEEIRKIAEILLTLKWKLTAEEFYEQNYSDLALKACENALQLYEKNTSFHSDITDKKLLQIFQDALVSCYILQAKILLSLNDCEPALLACDNGINIQKDNPVLYLYKGRTLFCLKEFEEAVEAYKIAIHQFEEAKKKDDTDRFEKDLSDAYRELLRANKQMEQKWSKQWYAMLPSSEKGMHRDDFINRDSEIESIREIFTGLVASDRSPSTSIIDFFGVSGIGKTRILRKIEFLCVTMGIKYIWLNVGFSRSQIVLGTDKKIPQSPITTEQIKENKGEITDEISLQLQQIKILLAKKIPIVVLLDCVDIPNEHQSDRIKKILSDLIEETNLCVVLASRQKLSFEGDWSFSRVGFRLKEPEKRLEGTVRRRIKLSKSQRKPKKKKRSFLSSSSKEDAMSSSVASIALWQKRVEGFVTES